MLKKTLGDKIAAAIRKADTSYLWENYAKQADAALKAIEDEGFVIVRREPSREMLQAGIKALQYGRVNKAEVLYETYMAMIEESLDNPD